jgi:ribonucleoside-diphosphate reductase alpha chain
MEGTRLLEVNPVFERIARDHGFYSQELMEKIAQKGSLQDIEGIPEDVAKVMVTDWDIAPKWHVKMQAVFQKYSDNSVSKTVNLPAEATPEDIRQVYMLAYELKCKGITIYRYGSKKDQVLSLPARYPETSVDHGPFITVDSEYSGGCVWCGRG